MRSYLVLTTRESDEAARLAGHLAVQSMLTGAATALIAASSWRALAAWWTRRRDQKPAVLIADGSALPVPARGTAVRVMLAAAQDDGVLAALQEADLVVLPVSLSAWDEAAPGRLAELCAAAQRPFVLAPIDADPDSDETHERLFTLCQHGAVATAMLSDDPAIAEAWAGGLTAMETGALGPAAEVAALWRYLEERRERLLPAPTGEIAEAAPAADRQPASQPGPVAEPSAAERRAWPRLATDASAAITVNADRLPCTLVDISAGGAFVAVDAHLREEDVVFLTVPGLGDFEAVARRRARHGVGLQFSLAETDRPRLDRRVRKLFKRLDEPAADTSARAAA